MAQIEKELQVQLPHGIPVSFDDSYSFELAPYLSDFEFKSHMKRLNETVKSVRFPSRLIYFGPAFVLLVMAAAAAGVLETFSNLFYSIIISVCLAAFYIPFIVGIFAFQRALRKASETLEVKLEAAVNDISDLCSPRGLKWELKRSIAPISTRGCNGNTFVAARFFKVAISSLDGAASANQIVVAHPDQAPSTHNAKNLVIIIRE